MREAITSKSLKPSSQNRKTTPNYTMRQLGFVFCLVISLFLCFPGCGGKSTQPKDEEQLPSGSSQVDVLAGNCTADEFKVNGVRTIAPVGKLFFAHPESHCSIPISAGEHVLTFQFGLLDSALATTPKPGGVKFEVAILRSNGSQTNLWSQELDPVANSADRGSHSQSLKISANAGDRILFTTLARAGKLNNWAYWSQIDIQDSAH
jgi:hypothetical protein